MTTIASNEIRKIRNDLILPPELVYKSGLVRVSLFLMGYCALAILPDQGSAR